MSYKYIVLPLLLGVSSHVLAADCGREDVDHYLDRGFTPAQVLDLCRATSTSTATDVPAPAEDSNLRYLREVMAAKSVELDQQTLSFTREMCVKYDRPNLAEQRKQACGIASYRIALQGLQVVDTRKKLLIWGQNVVTLEGPDKQQSYAFNQAGLSERDQNELQKELDALAFEVPIHEGVAVDAVAARIRGLAKP